MLHDAFSFLWHSLAISTHAAAIPFKDNHLALMRNTFRVVESGSRYALGRFLLVDVISGGGKSVVMEFSFSTIKHEEVIQGFQACE